MKMKREIPSPFTGRLSDADLRSLRVFCAVVRNKGFSSAEAELQISLSAISRDITSLETRMGIRLCTRGRTGFALTGEGEKFHDAAQALLLATDGFRARVNEIHTEVVGELNIGMVDMLWSDPSRRVTAALSAFARSQSRVHLNLSILSPNEIERRVNDATLDIGIVISRRKLSTLIYERLFVERNYVYCARGHALFDRQPDSYTLAELRSHAFAGRANSRMLPFYKHLSHSATCNSADLVAMLVLSGAYIGLLPQHFVEALSIATDFKPVMPSRLCENIAVYLVVRTGIEHMRTANAFVQAIRATEMAPT